MRSSKMSLPLHERWMPMENDRRQAAEAFRELLDIIEALRHPETGCPWDRVQTHESLKTYMIEEAYELLDAIDNFPGKIREELGDVLLQVLLHSRIAEEDKRFSITEVMRVLSQKLVARHPHVFGDAVAKTPEQVVQNWQQIKRSEGESRSVMDGIPKTLPALMRASKMGSRAAAIGFDWPSAEDAAAKAHEELDELLQESGDAGAAGEELGDLLFAMAQVARKLKFEPEELLQAACSKFARRFAEVEKRAAGKELSAEELEALWQEVKAAEKER